MNIFEKAIWKAVEKNKLNYVKELIKFFLNNDLPLEDKPSWYFSNTHGENLIYHAISCFGKETNPTEKLQRKNILNLIFDTLFKNAPAAIECLTTDNKTCFWLATYYQSLEMLERLLILNKKNLPILINKSDKVKQSRNSPLHLACQAGNVQIVEFLLKNKVDLTKSNANGNTALHIACATGHVKISTLLIQYNADIKQVNNDENTPLHLALANKQLEIANLLLDRIEELNISFPIFKNFENYLKINNHSTISATLESIKELIKNFITHRNSLYFGAENLFSIYTQTRYNFFTPPIVFIKQEHQPDLDKHRNTK